MKRLLDLAQGRIRMLNLRERVERDFAEFLAWLRARGIGDPYMYFSKETWDFMSFQRYWTEFQQERQAKAQADQRRGAIADLLKAGGEEMQGLVFMAVSAWPKERRETLVALLAGPIADAIQEEPPATPPIVAPAPDGEPVN